MEKILLLHLETCCNTDNDENPFFVKKILMVTSGMVVSFSALRRLKPMEAALYKASRVFNNCPAMATKLRAMNYNSEELAQAQKKQASYLMHLAARTTSKGQHCLSMRLTSEYFALDPEKGRCLTRKITMILVSIIMLSSLTMFWLLQSLLTLQ